MHNLSVFGFLQPFMDDPEIEEVWINSPNRIFVATKGRSQLTNLVLKDSINHTPHGVFWLDHFGAWERNGR
jgi:type IV secretory pathway ATPase VirB11/archaellum biosynthesis ATPase